MYFKHREMRRMKLRTNRTNVALTPVLIFLALVVGMGQCYAQTTASITGIATDPNGASIPGAKVTIANTNTGETRTTSSSQEGRYTFSLLIPAPYNLTVESEGFKKAVRPDIVLNAGQSAEANMKLELGAVVETVEVTASTVAMDTQSANQTTNLSQEQVLKIPVNYRNPLALVFTTAGVKSMIAQTGIRSVQDSFLDSDVGLFAMNGGREGSNSISIDGLTAKGGDWGQTFGTPQVDAVQEVQISRNTYDAEYGRVGNGVVNLVTRGGSNQWHGTGFEFLRNDKLDANLWEFNRNGRRKGALRRNQVGGTVSGPIWKSRRLYFLYGYEAARIRETPGDTATVPTLLERTGDFSQSRNADGSLQLIYDPFTTRPNPAGSGFVRDPFPGNRIPGNRFDAVGTGVTNVLFPKPNAAGVSISNANNFFGSGSHPRNTDRNDARLDWARSEKHSMFFHVTRNYFDERNQRIFRTGVENQVITPQGNDRGGPTYQMTLSNTFVPGPAWVINAVVGGGGNSSYARTTSIADGLDLTAIGYSAAFRDQFPIRKGVGQWTIGDYVTMGSAGQGTAARRTNSVAVTATNERGAHSIKFGFSGDGMILNNANLNTVNMSFNRGPTTGPVAVANSSVSGNTIAALLLGIGTGFSAVPISPAASNNSFNWFVQDTWKATRRLTLTLGLRYELQRPRTERYNQQSYFDYNLANPLGAKVGLPLTGGLVFSTPQDRGQTLPDYTDFAPRFGLAYKVTDRLVMRAGYGISYGRSLSDGNPAVNGNDGYSTTTPWIVSPGGVVPQYLLSNPYPQGLAQPTRDSLGASTFAGLSPTAWRRQNPTPYLQSYSLDFQYEVGRGSVLEAGYTGNIGRKFSYGVPVNYNQLDPQFLNLGERLNDLVPNPFRGVITTGALSGATVPRNQLLRPNPQFVAVNSAASEKGASSNFNSLFVKFTHRFEGGLSLLTTYQWSKALDNASEDQGWWLADARRNVYNAKQDYSVSAHDVPHDLVNTLIYQLPVGKGKKFGPGMAGVPQVVLGGWEVSGVIRFSSGTPINLRAPNTLADYGYGIQRPNFTNLQDLRSGTQTPEHWWNTSAVKAPGRFEIGTGPRFIPNLRIDGVNNVDMAILKNFSLKERIKAQFRAEIYNATNTPLFGIPPSGPQVTVGSGAFGTVTQTFVTGPRQIQLGLKLNF